MRRESASKRSRSRRAPARPAIAMRWMIALVEPPSAMVAVTAFSKASVVRMSRGFRSSQTISTMRRPAAEAMREWSESAAGIDDAPGSVMPSASAAAAIVDAVPMVMQVPNERAMPSSISRQAHSSSVARPPLGPVLPDVAAAAEDLAAPVAAQHRARRARRSPAGSC